MRMYSRIAMVCVVGLALLIAGPSMAQKAAPSAADAWSAEIAPLMTADIIGVLRFDVTAVDLDAIIKMVDDAAQKAGGEKVSKDEKVTEAKKNLAAAKKAGAKALYGLMDESVTDGNEPLMVVTLAPKANTAALAELLEAELVKSNKLSAVEDDDAKLALEFKGMLLVGTKAALGQAIKVKPVARPDLAAAMTAANGAPVTVAFVLPKAKRKEFMQMVPANLPDELGGGSTSSLGQIEWITIAIALPPKMSLGFTIKCETAAAAKDLQALLNSLLTAAEGMLDAAGLPDEMQSAAELILGTFKDFKLQAKGNTVAGGLNDKQITNVIVKGWSLAAAAFGNSDDDDYEDED